MPEPRDITDVDAQRIIDAQAALRRAQVDLEEAVAKALLNGASIRAVQDACGLSPNTIATYGRAHGWPTEENRRNFNKSRYPRR